MTVGIELVIGDVELTGVAGIERSVDAIVSNGRAGKA